MTAILTPEMGRSGGYTDGNLEYKSVDYLYAYPSELNLKPGSPLHDELVIKILDRARQSFNVMQQRHSSFNKIDDTLSAYIAPDDIEKNIKVKDARKPISIVVPYSFATLETILTYLVSAFLVDPIFTYEGHSPEDTIGAKLLELLINHQMVRSGGSLALHSMFRDGIAYNIAPLAIGWRREEGKRIIKEERGGIGKLFGLNPKKKAVPSLFYEGADLHNIDPYLCLPDPNQAIHRTKYGEFFGWIDEVAFVDLLEQESWRDSDLFNVRYLRHLKEQYTEFTVDPSARGKRFGMNQQRRRMWGTTNSKTVVNMYVNLIPASWKLGSSEYPEKWAFAIADGKILIKARPINLIHNDYPIAVGSPDFDGYSVAPVSRLELVDGLQEVLNFLFNSHVANVRRAINNMFVVDPSLINMPDFDDPTGGLLVRLRRAAWGRGVESAIKQLNVVDVTSNHVKDAFSIMDMGQRVTGATEGMMGIMRKGSERRSATESKGASQNATSRMERLAKVLSAQVMIPLAYQLAFNTQQMMSEDTYLKVSGEWPNTLYDEFGHRPGDKVRVTPFDILAQFDVLPKDGSLPTSGNEQAEQWVNLYQILSNSPILMQQFDMTRIFKHIARLMGAKNVSDFMLRQQNIQTSVQPDEKVLREAEKGNVIPINPEETQGAYS